MMQGLLKMTCFVLEHHTRLLYAALFGTDLKAAKPLLLCAFMRIHVMAYCFHTATDLWLALIRHDDYIDGRITFRTFHLSVPKRASVFAFQM